MTRDIPGRHNDRAADNDADVYAALWEAAPFPRLPLDAPNELKKLMINVDDPRRVYAIHRASRRHNFNILVERYINQLRYGCQSSICTTSTCFSCRKRLSQGAPVRRYNHTSARTLAIYLASQDNPEIGLCLNPSVDIPFPPIIKRSKMIRNPRNDVSQPVTRAETGTESEAKTAKVASVQAGILEHGDRVDTKKVSNIRSQRGTLVNAPPADHRSFVQNVFGTVAVKMVEWLTPRNLERWKAVEEREDPRSTEQGNEGENDTLAADSQGLHGGQVVASSSQLQRQEAANVTANEVASTQMGDSKPLASQIASPPISPTSRNRTTEPVDPPQPKGILSIMKKDSHPDLRAVAGNMLPNLPKRRSSQQTIIASPERLSETRSLHDVDLSSDEAVPNLQPRTSAVKPYNGTHQDEPRESDSEEAELQKALTPASTEVSLPDFALPQSISHLTIEVIDLLCDILQADGTAENHSLQPQVIYDGLKRRQNNALVLKRHSSPQTTSAYPSSLRKQWQSFIEQGFFDVLRNPESLLRSFSTGEKRMFDSQTIWYLMLRLTRVSPTLVFDSLWNVTGRLFSPPEKLMSEHDWDQEPQYMNAATSKPLSSHDAAQIMNICLQALVATAPLLTDAGQLANMSRIRADGLILRSKDAKVVESIELCLQYEDAFSDGMAMRLARRIFAAIPTRRRYRELLELHSNHEHQLDSDVLEIVLATLKSLDLGSPPILNFPNSERDFHEKRAPTLILDWAKTVLLQDWNGTPEIPSDGPLGGALAMITAIHKDRKPLRIGDYSFRIEYFGDRLDAVQMPLEWLDSVPNKRTTHLLDHPFLFQPSTLVTYFRAINYSRMNQAYEASTATYSLIRSTISEASLMTDRHRRDRLYERLSTATSRFIVLDIRRSHVLLDTFNSIWRREERELTRPLKIRLSEEGGEEGQDNGGVQQEFFRLAIAEALNLDYGAFTVDDRTKMTWFQPGSPEPLWKFELIGMIVSLAVYNGLTLPVTFPKALYRKLLDQDVKELHHIADGWPDLANGLTTLLEWDESEGLVEDVFSRTYEFSVEQFGHAVSRDMGTDNRWPQFDDSNVASNPVDAALVTNENRNSYVSDYIKWLTDISVRPQFEAFKTGFFSCIDRRSISFFDPSTLQSVLEGVQEIDIPELRRAARYEGWDANHKSVRYFWSIVKKYDMEEKKKLLEFVTASDRVPVGGMENLQFTLQRNGVDDEHLPTSYTCYGILLLPEYSSKDMMRQKLAMALENSKGFGFA